MKVITRATSNLYSPALICTFEYLSLEAQNTGSKNDNFHVISIGLSSICGKKNWCVIDKSFNHRGACTVGDPRVHRSTLKLRKKAEYILI